MSHRKNNQIATSPAYQTKMEVEMERKGKEKERIIVSQTSKRNANWKNKHIDSEQEHVPSRICTTDQPTSAVEKKKRGKNRNKSIKQQQSNNNGRWLS